MMKCPNCGKEFQYKRIIIIFSIIICAFIISSCINNSGLEKLQYPLTIEQLREYMDKCKLNYEVEMDDSYLSEGVNTFVIGDPDFTVLGIRTIGTDSERTLNVSFPKSSRVLPDDIYHGTKLLEAQTLFKFISYIYGGVSSETELYDMISEAYNSGDFIDTEVNNVFKWSGKINSIECEVMIETVPELESSVYLRTLKLSEKIQG